MHVTSVLPTLKKKKETRVSFGVMDVNFNGHTGYTKMGESITRFPIKGKRNLEP